jgi:hypothetical protein
MKYNPWGLAVALVVAVAAISSIPKVEKVKPYRFNWGLILVMTAFIILLILDGVARADDKNTHYCIQTENGNKTVTQCQNGTVTIVDNFSDKVVVCSTNSNEKPRCQTLAFKDKK